MSYTYKKPTTESKEGNLYAILWITLMCLFTTGTLLERYSEPEPTKIPYILTHEGFIKDLKPHYIDEHCTKN